MKVVALCLVFYSLNSRVDVVIFFVDSPKILRDIFYKVIKFLQNDKRACINFRTMQIIFLKDIILCE